MRDAHRLIDYNFATMTTSDREILDLPIDRIPTLDRRYISSALDGMVIIIVLMVAASLPGDFEAIRFFRGALIFGSIFVYEPFSTAYAVTLGQFITGIRVRRLSNPQQKISLGAAYGRWLVKIALGLLSFFYAFFSKYRMTIHDLCVGSIVLKASCDLGTSTNPPPPDGVS